MSGNLLFARSSVILMKGESQLRPLFKGDKDCKIADMHRIITLMTNPSFLLEFSQRAKKFRLNLYLLTIVEKLSNFQP